MQEGGLPWRCPVCAESALPKCDRNYLPVVIIATRLSNIGSSDGLQSLRSGGDDPNP
jgi:hypothetical protein